MQRNWLTAFLTLDEEGCFVFTSSSLMNQRMINRVAPFVSFAMNATTGLVVNVEGSECYAARLDTFT